MTIIVKIQTSTLEMYLIITIKIMDNTGKKEKKKTNEISRAIISSRNSLSNSPTALHNCLPTEFLDRHLFSVAYKLTAQIVKEIRHIYICFGAAD